MAEADPRVLEHLRAIRADMAQIDQALGAMAQDVAEMRADLARFTAAREPGRADISAIKARLDRIERRLGLVDGTGLAVIEH